MSDDAPDVDTHLQELETRIDDLRDRGWYATACRLSREMKRLAKQEQRVIPYLKANFCLMNDAQSLFDPELGKEAAMESIALLESEELARKHQPDFPENAYQGTVAWMSTCAYDNLAKHVAETDGYNSEGIHECISDGLQVCRRTGKLECTTCFREYAGDVYRASDDLDMATHYARAGFGHQPKEGGMDRRWISGKDVVNLLELNGQVEAAIETLLQAFQFIETYHAQNAARLSGSLMLESLLWLTGREAEWLTLRERVIPNGVDVTEPPVGEDPSHELKRLYCDVIIATRKHDYPSAIEMLTRMDRMLATRQCLSNWFEVRLRLIALQLLAGNTVQAEALGRPLEAKAKPARDWLTLRRLRRLLSGEISPTPTAAVEPFSSGPFALNSVVGTSSSTGQAATGLSSDEASSSENLPVSAEASTSETDANESPMAARLRELEMACKSADSEAAATLALNDLVAVELKSVTDAVDASWLVWLAHVMAGPLDRSVEAWRWAKPLLSRCGQDATTLNVLATLAWAARSQAPDDEADTIATLEQIEKWYRTSLDLNADHARNHSRAGQFYWSLSREGEAERCWARSFRLNRSDAQVALQLARVYDATDRRSDGLAVLDMCIREGADDPELFWDAGVSALSLERWELVVTYFDRFEELSPEQSWTHYYRALALLELHRPDEVLAALDLEAARSPNQLYGVTILRINAFEQRDDIDGLRAGISDLLTQPLSDVDYVSVTGFIRLFEKLYASIQKLPADDPQRQQVELLALQAGMMPDDYFAPTRTARPKQEGVNFYVVEVSQPLDERWASLPGRFAGLEEWTGYLATWGVLALDEEAAKQLALEAQSHCFPLSGEVKEVLLQGEGYTDSPGIVWQGRREELTVGEPSAE